MHLALLGYRSVDDASLVLGIGRGPDTVFLISDIDINFCLLIVVIVVVVIIVVLSFIVMMSSAFDIKGPLPGLGKVPGRIVVDPDLISLPSTFAKTKFQESALHLTTEAVNNSKRGSSDPFPWCLSRV